MPTRLAASYSGKLRTYLTFPAINIANTWRGASEIVAKYNFSLDAKTSILNLFTTAPTDANFVACISWKPTSDTIVRYRLWSDVGEILWVDDYDGQTINEEFAIEIWNTPDANLAGGPYTIELSTLQLPADFCDDEDVELGSDFRICTDLIFDLGDYTPLDSDYYVVVSDCGVTQLIENKIFADSWLIRADDGTWRYFKLTVDVGGSVNSYTEEAPTPDPIPVAYMPLVDRFSGLGFQVNCGVIEYEGVTTYHPYASTFVDDDVHSYGVIYLKADDDQYYGVRLLVEDWHSYPLVFPVSQEITGTFRIMVDQIPTEQ